ncbi:MAG: DNA repair protein RadC, partial [Bacteroidales bacterium]|nr:DNA repair protein RadC [Bacteroidales bacterium]
MNIEYKNVPISAWAEDDRPREKLILKGRSALSNAELIAILIGSGNRKESAVELSKRILQSVNSNLLNLSRLTVTELQQFKGIGQAKAIAIVAALELGNRKRSASISEKKKIVSSRDVFEYFQDVLNGKNYEEFWILMLNQANHIIKKLQISEGGISGTVADPRKIFKIALDHMATSIILCHNHPSGSVKPSQNDLDLTKNMRVAGNIMSIPIL